MRGQQVACFKGKNGVDTINELDEDKMQSCIDYITQRSDNSSEVLI